MGLCRGGGWSDQAPDRASLETWCVVVCAPIAAALYFGSGVFTQTAYTLWMMTV